MTGPEYLQLDAVLSILSSPALAARALSRRVSLESRYGACAVTELARALMHMPSMVSDMLMLFASSARSPAQQHQPQVVHCNQSMVWAIPAFAVLNSACAAITTRLLSVMVIFGHVTDCDATVGARSLRRASDETATLGLLVLPMTSVRD